MRGRSGLWLGAAAVVLALAVPVLVFLPRGDGPVDDPWSGVPQRLPTTDHASLLPGPFTDGPAVTRRCLECHEDAAHQIMQTTHWTWETDPVALPGRATPQPLGKKNVINNFCIGVPANWEGCTSCHAGYGWKDAGFDFQRAEAVDCLVCHDHTGTYRKGPAGQPAAGVDLAAVARSVGGPSRGNCGGCHFRGGGGDAVKHGDLDGSLLNPSRQVDVHMGAHDMVCTDCHRTVEHQIGGRSITTDVGGGPAVACTDCHAARPHGEERLDLHTAALACQTCHIPQVALRESTKTHWDWSTAGQERDEDPHLYLKKKGSFAYARGLRPEFAWFSGGSDRYLLGDPIDPGAPTVLNRPHGSPGDPAARIWPFKVHRGRQPYDTRLGHLLVPNTFGDKGYWKTFDWDQSFRRGSEAAGIGYSGEFGFADTEMYWPLMHMVQPADQALQCRDCHAPDGVMDWTALGYPGDPMEWGGRNATPEAR